MKKLAISALALTLISFASVQAQTTEKSESHATHQQATTQQATTQKDSKEEKVAVKPEDLPEGIKKTIQGDEFSGWTVKKAFLVTEDGNKQYYELQVAKGKENARVKLDKDGRNVG